MEVWIVGEAMGHKVATVAEIGGKGVKTYADTGTTEIGQHGRATGEKFHVDGGVYLELSDFGYGGDGACEERGKAAGANDDNVLLGNDAKCIEYEAVFIEYQEKDILGTQAVYGGAEGGVG
jgi:hypothetical protein